MFNIAKESPFVKRGIPIFIISVPYGLGTEKTPAERAGVFSVSYGILQKGSLGFFFFHF